MQNVRRQRQPRGKNMDIGGEGSIVGSIYAGSQAPPNIDGAPVDPPLMAFVPAPISPKKKKKQTPQETIDQFWDKFSSKTPGKASTILPKDPYAKTAGDNVPKGAVKGENAVASYEEAAKNCKEKVEKIVKECRRVNQKYRDTHFDIEFDLKWGKNDYLTALSGSSDGAAASFEPKSVKRVTDIFKTPQFFVNGPTANDIRQGRDGDCWLLASLMTLNSSLIEKICVARDEQIGVYGFVFHRDGEWISEIIDDKLYLLQPDYDESWEERFLVEDQRRINSEEDYRSWFQTNSKALYFAQCEDENETWLPLLEKAYAKAHGDYSAIEGGFTGEGVEDLTGGVTTEVFSTDILDKEYFWKEELMKVNTDFLFGCSSGLFWGHGDRKGIYEGHAYSLMKAVEIDGKRLCLLRNPWGMGEWTGPWSDGSKEWTPEWMQKLNHRFGDDGAFWMSYEDLLKKYELFDRTRLFTDEWKVTQKWTSLTIPWAVDYNDTKFSFTLEKKAPVVIVLSQLDDRYFCGLEGEYNFQLSFRVHKAGEEDYIVRSRGTYVMRRSVTAELELEPGEYHVLMKVEAVRNTFATKVEDVVRNNVKDRRDKLLRIGLAYDLAHAKGHIEETEEEKKGKKKAEDVKKAKEKKEIKDNLMKAKLREKHASNRLKRKDRVVKEKRKAKDKIKAEKKAAKEKEENEKAAKEKEAQEKESKVAEGTKELTKESDQKGGQDAPKEDSKEVKSPETEKAPNTETKSEGIEAKTISETSPKPTKATFEKAAETASASTDATVVEAAKPSEETSKVDASAPAPVSTETVPTEAAKSTEETQKVETAAPESAKSADETPKDSSAPAPAVSETTTAEPTKSTPELTKEETSAPAPIVPTLNLTPPSVGPDGSFVPPSIGGFDDDDDDSDIVSVISEISSRAIDDMLAEEASRDPIDPIMPADESEDEFEKDPWNAVAVVGLRVYSKDSQVSIKIIRPNRWEDGEAKLDIDDSARDATKELDVEKEKNDELKKAEEEKKGEDIKKEDVKSEDGKKEEIKIVVDKKEVKEETEVKPEPSWHPADEKKDDEESETKKSDEGSEGSIVIV